jgi:membrane-associated phospholipid phosphatase
MWGTWFPRWRWFFVLVLALVMFSTIFTHQHYWLDIVGGTVMGAAGIWVGFWGARRVEETARQ